MANHVEDPNESSPLMGAVRQSSVDSAPPLPPPPTLLPKTFVIKLFLPAVVILYFFGYIVSVIIVNPYVYDKISAQYPSFNISSKHPCTIHQGNHTDNSTDIKIQNEIQKRVATFELHLHLVSFLLALAPALCLGPLSDRYGRKIGFIFPIVGTALKQVVYCLVIGFGLRLEVMFLGNILESLGGGFATMLMSMFSTISDITVPGKGRSLGITFMEGLQTITSCVSLVIMSRWLKTSYMQPLIFAMTLEVFAFILAISAMPETVARLEDDGPHGHQSSALYRAVSTGLNRIKNTFTLYLYDDKGRLAKRRICLTAFMLTVAVNFSKSGVQTLYLMKEPMCWANEKVLFFTGIQLAVNWVIIWLLLIVLQTYLNMKDRQVAILGCVSSLLACVFMSLVTTDVMLYEVAALGVMTRSIIPMLRSTISSIVDSTDQGAVFAGMGCIEILGAGVFGMIANRIYFGTIDFFAGTIFLVFAGLMLLALILLIIMNGLFAREERVVPGRSRSVNYEEQD